MLNSLVTWKVLQYFFTINMLYGTTVAREECGIQSGSRGRIVGGEDVKGYDYPWFARLHHPEKPHEVMCGGSLVSSSYVLTAAHCYLRITRKITEEYRITLGSNNRCKKQRTQRTFSVRRVIIHPRFSAETYDNDIAIVQLSSSAAFIPICLPAPEHSNYTNRIGEIVGYGRMKQHASSFPCKLQKAAVEIFPPEGCGNSKLPGEMSNHFVCAGVLGGGVDSCQGDSGGPLQVVDSGRFVLIGIVSFGVGCALNGFPGLYSYIPYHLDWIERNIRKERSNQLSSSRRTLHLSSRKQSLH